MKMPKYPLDVVLDTDAYNEIDDQFAIAYLLRSKPQLRTLAIYAAPFRNALAATPEEGMEKSYDEILKVLELCGEKTEVYRGSKTYLPDERTPVDSPAARDLVEKAMRHTAEDPLYVVAIGAITNVASALLLKPEIAERIVVVWLGGHAHHYHDTEEFNMMQDYGAARVVMGSAAPFVQLPCFGVVSGFTTTEPELEKLLFNKNPLADYLARNIVAHMHQRGKEGSCWSKAIWDVTAVGWLLNENDRFMLHRRIPVRLPDDSGYYREEMDREIDYVYYIKRDELMADLVEKLTGSCGK